MWPARHTAVLLRDTAGSGALIVVRKSLEVSTGRAPCECCTLLVEEVVVRQPPDVEDAQDLKAFVRSTILGRVGAG